MARSKGYRGAIEPGDLFVWEVDKPWACEVLRVVRHDGSGRVWSVNGWTVERPGREVWNTQHRFREAALPLYAGLASTPERLAALGAAMARALVLDTGLAGRVAVSCARTEDGSALVGFHEAGKVAMRAIDPAEFGARMAPWATLRAELGGCLAALVREDGRVVDERVPGTRTREEVERLKRDWLADGTWDIEDAEGFQAHRGELLAFRREVELRRNGEEGEGLGEERGRMRGRMRTLGCSLRMLVALEAIERRVGALERRLDGDGS